MSKFALPLLALLAIIGSGFYFFTIMDMDTQSKISEQNPPSPLYQGGTGANLSRAYFA